MELREVLIDQVGAETWLRFRYLAPEIGREGQGRSFDTVAGDFDVLCAEDVLPYMAREGLRADKVAIGLSDIWVPFGASDATATQFIELFRIEDGQCVWEAF